MADNVFRATLHYFWLGQTMNNVLHFSGPSSDPAQREVLADALVANWINVIRFRQTRDVKYRLIQVRLLESQFPTLNKTIAIDGLATVNTANIPITAHILRLHTAVIGRSGRGRVYIGGLPDATTSAGFLTETELNFWNAHFADILAAFGPGGSTPFRLGVAPKVNSTANFKEVVEMQLAPTLGVQRRRNMGVGV